MTRRRLFLRLLIIAGFLTLALVPVTQSCVRGLLLTQSVFVGVGQGGIIFGYEPGGWVGDPPEYAAFWFDVTCPSQMASLFVYVPLWFASLACGVAGMGILHLVKPSRSGGCPCGYSLDGLPVTSIGAICCPECGREQSCP